MVNKAIDELNKFIDQISKLLVDQEIDVDEFVRRLREFYNERKDI